MIFLGNNRNFTDESVSREKKIVKTSMLGIFSNVILVILKAIVGLQSRSIAVILDAVNNLSDVLSSVITVIGTKLSGKKPDKKHPYGHGRIEYITGVIIAMIIFIAGLTSLKESVIKIFKPEKTNYTSVTLLVIIIGIIVKLFLGVYVKKQGRILNSSALAASGTDALFDSVLTGGTLIAAVAGMVWRISAEGIVGVIISLFILRAGVEILGETLNSIIGERADSLLTEELREMVNSYDAVLGVYDIALHNYGPTNIIGSVHIEVPDSMTAKEIHRISRRISADVYMKFGIIITVGIYASNGNSEEVSELKKYVYDTVNGYPAAKEIHGFYIDNEHMSVTFDIVVDFAADAEKIRAEISQKLGEKFPDYTFFIVIDSDYSD